MEENLENVYEHNSFAGVKEKRERTRFNIFQRAELEKAFIASPYLAPRQRHAIAARLKVKPVAVQVILNTLILMTCSRLTL